MGDTVRMIDLAELSESDVVALPEADVLDFDDAYDLRAMLVERACALPYERYLSLCASCLDDIRIHLGPDVGDERGLALMACTIKAASGGLIGTLLDDWDSYAGLDVQNAEYSGGLDARLFWPCRALAYELTTSKERFSTAEDIAQSAMDCVDDFVAGENLRILMRFVIRARARRG